ncbi:MAG: hypothetical protein IKS02_03170 [Fibrobacter sp.]|nr:hypothetical protein [Fibrobacter sp.]
MFNLRIVFFLCCILVAHLFASSVHQGLKAAIDAGDFKTAENLTKNIGVKDIYCPSTLKFTDAYKIFGSRFDSDPARLWSSCDSAFIENAKGTICKTSIPLCKFLLSKEEVSLWTPYLNDILESRLNQKYSEERLSTKESYQRATKEECMEDLNMEKSTANVFLEFLKKQYCEDEDAVASTILCATMYVPAEDSLKRYFNNKEKKCRTNPVKKTKKKVQEKIVVNPFALEIEKYGIWISKQMKMPRYFNKKTLELYYALRKNRKADSLSLKEYARELMKEENFWGEKKGAESEQWGRRVILGCMAFEGIDSLLKVPFYLGGGNISCERVFLNDKEGISWILQRKEYVIQQLISVYAEKGTVPDSLTVFSCRLHNNIDKDIEKLTGVKIFDCKITKNFEDNVFCKDSSTPYMWKSPSGEKFICEQGNFRLATEEENKADGLCSSKNLFEEKNGYYCSRYGWEELLTDERDGKKYKTVKIEGSVWMAQDLEYKVKEGRCGKDKCEKYGRYYSRDALQDVCPKEWRLPTLSELKDVEQNGFVKLNLNMAGAYILNQDYKPERIDGGTCYWAKYDIYDDVELFGFSECFEFFNGDSFVSFYAPVRCIKTP